MCPDPHALDADDDIVLIVQFYIKEHHSEIHRFKSLTFLFLKRSLKMLY